MQAKLAELADFLESDRAGLWLKDYAHKAILIRLTFSLGLME